MISYRLRCFRLFVFAQYVCISLLSMRMNGFCAEAFDVYWRVISDCTLKLRTYLHSLRCCFFGAHLRCRERNFDGFTQQFEKLTDRRKRYSGMVALRRRFQIAEQNITEYAICLCSNWQIYRSKVYLPYVRP